LDGGADGYEFGAGCEGCEVAGVSHAHAANACYCYLELFGHDEDVMEGEIES
jgi:hypothetical protein